MKKRNNTWWYVDVLGLSILKVDRDRYFVKSLRKELSGYYSRNQLNNLLLGAI